jgi:hypothetical protein
MSGTDNGGLPDTGRHPAYMNIYDTQVFNDAGLTPLSVLRDRFGTDYAALIADAKRLDAGLDDSQWNILMVKAECGGHMTLAKLMKLHGGKGEVAKDFGKHEDTANRWEKLYKTLPWAMPIMRAEAAVAIAKGEEYTYSIERVIKVGTDEAIRRGATEAPKPKYSGTGQVLLMDPSTKTVTLTDLPATFVNTKRQKPWWEEDPTIKLAAGVSVWVEKESDAKGYFSYEFPEPVGKRFFLNQRVVIARITKQNAVLDLGFTNLDHALNSANFHARAPKKVRVFDIDPETGKLSRDFEMMDNEYLEKGDTVETPMSGILDGLTLVQDETKSRHMFSIFDKRYAGRSLIVRFDADSRWLAPLATSVSAGDLLQHVSWITLDAVNKAAHIQPVADPNEGFEELDDAKAQDYFGCDMAHIRDYAVREWGTGDGQAHLRQHDMLREIANTDDKDAPVTLIYHVAKIRGIVQKWRSLEEGKARAEAEAKAKAEADGFRNLGSVEAHDLFGPRPELDNRVREIFGLPLNEGNGQANGEVDDLLEKAGCFRIVAGRQYWHVEKLRRLLATGTTEEVQHPPASDAVDGGFGTGPTPEPVEHPPASEAADGGFGTGPAKPVTETTEPVEPVEATTELAEPVQPVEATTELAEPVQPVEATTEPAEPVEATTEPVEPVTATTEPAEPVEATTEPVEPVEATTEPAEPEIVPYGKLPYGERELADRKLQDAIIGLVQQADRKALRTLTQVLGPNKQLLGGSADQQRERVKQLADTLDKVLSVVRQIEPLITDVMDHLDVAKSERSPTFDEIIAFYANTRGGERRTLWQKPEGDPKIDVLAYVVKTATKGEITLPTMPDEGDQPSIH